MLETAEERVKLLKAGITGETIEELYVEYNGFKIYNILDNILYKQYNKSGASVPFIGLN